MIQVGDIWRLYDGEVFVYAISADWVYYICSGDKMLTGSCFKGEFIENAEFIENVYHAQSYEKAKNAKPKNSGLLKRIAKEILK